MSVYYVRYAPVDQQFKVLERDLPAGVPYTADDPEFGITYGFSLEAGRRPLPPGAPDIRYGSMTRKVVDRPEILFEKVTKADYDTAYRIEMDAREVEAIPPVPESISMRQARLQLSRVGLLEASQNALATFPGQEGVEARIEWEYATTLLRTHPLITGLASILGLDDKSVDDLFRAAAQIL